MNLISSPNTKLSLLQTDFSKMSKKNKESTIFVNSVISEYVFGQEKNARIKKNWSSATLEKIADFAIRQIGKYKKDGTLEKTTDIKYTDNFEKIFNNVFSINEKIQKRNDRLNKNLFYRFVRFITCKKYNKEIQKIEMSIFSDYKNQMTALKFKKECQKKSAN